jgi:hypothetical protein
MSSPNQDKTPINDGDDDEDEEEEDFQEEDYNDDDEDEFVPGMEDDDYDDDEENAKEANYIQGILRLDEKMNVQYKGDGFYLSSTESAPWNFFHTTTTTDAAAAKKKNGSSKQQQSSSSSSVDDSFTLTMNGFVSIADADKTKKPTPRKFQVTWKRSSQTAGAVADIMGGTNTTTAAAAKSEEEDGNKLPAIVYHIYGKQIDDDITTAPGDWVGVEFQGDLQPPPKTKKDNNNNDGKSAYSWDLLCQVRLIKNATAQAVVAATAAAAKHGKSKNDDDDEIEDADEEVDFNEVIALNEESQIPVEALRKRYQNGGGIEEEQVPPKRGKIEDDDADIGF